MGGRGLGAPPPGSATDMGINNCGNYTVTSKAVHIYVEVERIIRYDPYLNVLTPYSIVCLYAYPSIET
jgi:hypothetical protein